MKGLKLVLLLLLLINISVSGGRGGQAPTTDQDTKTAQFIDSVYQDPDNLAWQHEFDKLLTAASDSQTIFEANTLFLLVPGWLYQTHGRETGSDMAAVRAALDPLNACYAFVDVEENGTIELNALVIAEAIKNTYPNPVVLVSASKGSAEVAAALAHLAEHDLKHVKAWLSVGGTLRGTPLADIMLTRRWCWISRLILSHDHLGLEGLQSLSSARRKLAFERLQLPSHILKIALVPVPFRADLTQDARFGYKRLRSQGPNDGLALLHDQVFVDGITLLAVGSDHYFKAIDVTAAVHALLTLITERIPS